MARVAAGLDSATPASKKLRVSRKGPHPVLPLCPARQKLNAGEHRGPVFLGICYILSGGVSNVGQSSAARLPIGEFWTTGDHRDYDIMPDSNRFLVFKPTEALDGPGDPAAPRINIVLNWFQELTERVPIP